MAGSTPVIVSEYEYEGASAWKPGYYEEVLNIEGITAVNGNYDITLVAGDLEVKKAQREDVQIQDIAGN